MIHNKSSNTDNVQNRTDASQLTNDFIFVQIKAHMDTIHLQKVNANEVAELQKISRKTFFETFSESNSESDMEKYLQENLSIETLSEELNQNQSEFYFALREEEVIAYLKLNFDSKYGGVEIQRIYVLKEYHGKQVAQMLYDKALEVAEKRNAPHMWLGVWEENPRAIRFYEKNGFIAVDKHSFRLGDDEQTDIIMKKLL